MTAFTFHGTTILSVRRGAQVAMGGDGQVTLGNVVVKATARKVRRLYHDQVLAGFAGATADAFTLFERFEAKLEKHQGHLVRSAIELTKDWRTDRVLRRLLGHVHMDHHSLLICKRNDSTQIVQRHCAHAVRRHTNGRHWLVSAKVNQLLGVLKIRFPIFNEPALARIVVRLKSSTSISNT